MKKLSLLFFLPFFLIQCKSPGTSDHKNVVVIIADDLGWADLGIYGSSFYDSPNLDKLAKDGAMFTNAYAACPVCSPTRASLQTGKYPERTGISDWIKGHKYQEGPSANDRFLSADNTFMLGFEHTTIAEALKEKGYRTFFAGKWHLGEEEEYWPENRGYDINKGGWKVGMPRLDKDKDPNGFFTPYGNPRLEDGPPGEYLPDRITDETIEFIENNREQPFFVFLSYYLVHVPLQCKDSLINIYEKKRVEMGLDDQVEFLYDEPWMKSAWFGGALGPDRYKERIIQSEPTYAAMIKSLDINVGRVLETLEMLELDENTLVIFTSDNGGLSTAQGSVTTNSPLRKGKGWLYEGGIRVPFIIKYPQSSAMQTTSDFPVSSFDIFPTVLSYTGTDVTTYDIDGIDLLPVLEGKNTIERPLFWHYPHYSGQGGSPGSAVRLGNYKLLHDLERDEIELYDLNTDIGEQTNLADDLPGVKNQLYSLLENWKKEVNAKELEPNPAWNGLKLGF